MALGAQSGKDNPQWPARPDIVIVQLGTNDSPSFAGGFCSRGSSRLASYGGQFVCIGQTIRRRLGILFNKNVDILTRHLRVVLEPIPYVIYWGHRAFGRHVITT